MDFYDDYNGFLWENHVYLKHKIIVRQQRTYSDRDYIRGDEHFHFGNITFEFEKDYISNIYKYPRTYDWKIICRANFLPEKFLRDFHIYLDWFEISSTQKLSENFIRDYANQLYWNVLSIYQNLSEKLIEDFINKVDIFSISRKQFLSKNFIIKYFDRLDLEGLLRNKNINEETENYIRMFV